MKNKFWILFLLILVFSIFWSCAKKDPIGIDQYVVNIPTTDFLINTNLLMDGDDYSIGYYNGNIQTNQMQMNWTQSSDDDFLCYKVMRMDGEPEERSMEGFEGGTIPANYTTWGDFGGWFVTDEYSYEGNYCARTHEGNYGYEYLETTINVPQNTDIIISFFAAAVNDGEGSFRINGMTYGYWYNNQWQHSYYVYNTGNNTTLSMQWLYYTYDYGFGVIDNIQILGAGSNYETLTTFTDVSATSIIDTLLEQNSFYTYNLVAINNSGGCQQDQITIKTPRWEAPDNILVNGLSPEVIEVTWNDNSDSENNFTVYTFMDINTTYELIDSVQVDNNITSLILDDLDTNEAYLFAVKASNSFENDTIIGNSDYFIFNDLVFAQPTDLIGYQIAGSKSISLSWTDNSNLETGFSIERKINNGTYSEITAVDRNIIEYIDNDTLNFEYSDIIKYRIRAFNNYENIIYTNYSNETMVVLSEINGVYLDFEDGQFPIDWTTWTYGGTEWFITSNAAYEGINSIKCGGGSYDEEYLETTIDVPQNTNITISFYTREDDTSGDGYMLIDGSYYFDWDNNSSSWSYESVTYYTSPNSEITLTWYYNTQSYGNCFIDNIEITW
ncbi:MAG: fibronectin type III domain-containing protein [Candidatus Tenebribacter burtonii]|nr:fibronectin type III domain-containing protein [Candidatus Tenebribacter burtonii]